MASHPRFTFVGIEPLVNSNGFAFAALDEQLNLLAIGEGSPKDVFAYLLGQEAVLTGIHAPGFTGQAAETYPQVDASHPPAKEYRFCEHQIWKEKIPINFTTAKISKMSASARRGYQLIQTLQRYGFIFAHQSPANKILIETQPAACYHQLIDKQPLQEDSFLGRIQRQLALHNHHLPVQDPMGFFEEITRYKLLMGKITLKSILIPEELNALVIAYTAWLVKQKPDQMQRWGDGSDGEIILPINSQVV
ncbi:MAG: DUF429 domain-containing protein [Anaerolineaceae bacterium]|nr:DUF429 domain-containing protein [Anaerolineaceae bacterium]